MLATVLSLALLAAPPDIVLVTIDTLRADHVGAYGAASGATPGLDALALRGVVLEEAVVQVPQTRPSHASLLTGLLPFEHGLRDNASPPLPRTVPTLASSLKKAGYATAAFIAAYPVSRASGLDAGFDVFDDPFGGDLDFLAGAGERNERPAHEVVTAALAWMAKPSTRPRFIWLHFFEPHHPYEPPPPFAERFARSPYDGEVATADAQLKRFLDRYPASASRMVVVTSDHGEGLGDHGEEEHHLFVYDSTLRIPLVMAGGGLPAGRRVRGQFRSIDLMPTLLDFADVAPPHVTGASRARNIRTGAVIPDNESYAESLYGAMHFGYAPVRALRAEGFKYIDTPRAELYRVASDPGEAANLMEERAPLASAMRARLLQIHGEDAARVENAAPADPASLERLAALGYVGGVAPSTGPAPRGGPPDPKDQVEQYNRYSRAVNTAIAARRRDDPEAVVKALTPLAREFSDKYSVVSYLGQARLEQGRFDEALPYLTKARDLSPKAGPPWARLAEAYLGAGKAAEALEATDQGLRVSPHYSDLLRLRPTILTRLGREGEALAFLEKSYRENPRDGAVAAELASAKRNAGDLRSADALSARAVQLAPANADVWVSRGLTLGAMSRGQEAAAAFAKARERAPNVADGWFFGAAIAIQGGDGDTALKLLARAEELEPRRPGLREARAAAEAARGAGPQPSAQPAAGAVRLSIIRTRTRAEAVEALRRVSAGQDFAAVAREVSLDPSRARGGDLGWLRPEDLRPPLNAAAKSLSRGGVSPILEVQGGFVILQRDP
jgi:arylsulfatase A-like enzyme/parvulin-like peptidyl-prolyl isomerase